MLKERLLAKAKLVKRNKAITTVGISATAKVVENKVATVGKRNAEMTQSQAEIRVSNDQSKAKIDPE